MGKGVRQNSSARLKMPKVGPHRLAENLRYNVDLDYDTDTSCDESGCNQEGICRCSTISNARVTEVDCVSLLDDLLDSKASVIDRYCVERLLNLRLKDADWNIDIDGGYYGEKIGAVTIDGVADVIKELGLLLGLPAASRLPTVLEAEYGYLLPPLKDVKRWKVVTVPKTKVRLGNANYATKLDPLRVERYARYTLPKGVGIVEAGGVRLLDGYHRFTAATEKEVQIICPI